jgi:NitT/TauT family transport system substrate-binding protein
MRTFRAWRIVAIALGCTVALGCSASAQTLTKVTVGSATVTTTPLGATYSSLPIALFWKQEGLDVKYVGLPGANAALQALIAGTVDMVPGTNSALFAMYQKYPDANVMSYFTHTTAFNSVPVVLKDSELKTIKDLEGKNVGVQSLANSQVPVTKALVTLEGGDAGKLKFIAVGEGPEAAHALVAKRVDSLALFDGLYASIEAAGTPLHELTTHALNRDRLGFNAALWARRDYLKDRRDVLVRLGRGVAKSVIFAKANPEAAIRVHWEVFPATKPRGVSDADAMRQSLANLNARLRNIDIVEGLVGNSTTQQINGYMDLMVTGGMLDARLPLERFWDPSLLKDINDFDREAVRKQAQDWKG